MYVFYCKTVKIPFRSQQNKIINRTEVYKEFKINTQAENLNKQVETRTQERAEHYIPPLPPVSLIYMRAHTN